MSEVEKRTMEGTVDTLDDEESQPHFPGESEVEKRIIDQYNVLRVVLAGPPALDKEQLPAPQDFVPPDPKDPTKHDPDQSKEFAPRIPLADWKPLTDPRISSQGLAVIPTSLDFGTIVQNRESESQTVTLINNGTEPVVITSVTLTGSAHENFILKMPAAPDSAACKDGSTLQVGGACTRELSFKPSSVGPKAALLVFDTSSGQLVVQLTGGGSAAS